MNRREFITLFGGATAAPAPLWPRAICAQLQPKMLRVGFVGFNPASPRKQLLGMSFSRV